MPNVTVSQPNSIKVTVGSASNPRITTATQFTGATSANVTNEIQGAYNTANSSYALANTAVQQAGGAITGNLIIAGTLQAGRMDAGRF
jgi:hypothetical protein